MQDNVWYRTQLRRYFPLQWIGPNLNPQKGAPEDYLPRSYFLRHHHTIPIKASPQARQCCLWIMTSDTTALENAGFTFKDVNGAMLEPGIPFSTTKKLTRSIMLTWMATPRHATLKSHLYQQRLDALDTNRFWFGPELNRTYLLCNPPTLTILHWVLELNQSIETIETLIGPIAALNDMEKRRLWFKAVAAGHMPMTKILFHSIININMPDSSDCYALYLAVSHGQTAMVDFLLKHGADVELGSGRNTPLYKGVEQNFNDIVVMLLHAGANVEGDPEHYSTPLSAAIYYENEHIIHMLLEYGASLSTTSPEGNTPLHSAIYGENDTIVMRLLTNGANASARNKDENTPLHIATEKGLTKLAAILINADPTLINQKNVVNQTPLYIAAEKGHEEIVELMLNSGVAQLELEAEFGRTPYRIATLKKHEAVAQLLAEHHANTPSSSQEKLAYTM